MAEARHSRLQWLVHTIAIALVFCQLAMGRTIRVANDGTADHATIQAAIDASADRDVVLVAPGIYTGDGNRDISFRGKAITVKSERGPRSCIIDCEGAWYDRHRGLCFRNGETRNSVLDGFTVTGGIQGSGAGILCSESSPVIRNCLIVRNIGTMGSGICLFDSDALVSNCVIAGNLKGVMPGGFGDGDGGGLHCERGRPVVQNCTICGNRSGSGGGVQCADARTTAVFINCILAGNEAWSGNGNQLFSGGCWLIVGCANVKLINCCIEDEPNAIFVEKWSDPRKIPESCIQADPLFAQEGHWDPNGTPGDLGDGIWVDGDYHLKSQAGRWDPNAGTWVKDDVTSPCVDAGDPNGPVGGEPAPNGGRINMGAYGGTTEASKSITGFSGKYGGGSGAAGNPYLIFTAEHLDTVGAEPDDWDKHFKLMADIDLSGYTGQELHLIGIDATSPFSGVFDGSGHRISGLGRRNPAGVTSAALFGYLTGTVQGVGLIDPNVGGRLLYYTGALVGDNHGTVSDCYVEDVNVVGGGWNAGGLVGRNLGTIVNCRSTGVVRDRCAGGLVGKNAGTIASCSSSAIVVGTGPVGGLVGSGVDGAISNSCSTGTVTGDDRTGGLVGHNYGGTITCCYSSAVIVGNDGVGGLVGENWQGLITNCYSAANVIGDRLTAGLVGDSGGGAITNCYAVGPVVGRWPAGGIVSWRHDDDIVTGCLWDMETTGREWSAAGTGKTTAEMQTAATFLAAGWDLAGETTNGTEDVWQMPGKPGYPKLFWETGAK